MEAEDDDRILAPLIIAALGGAIATPFTVGLIGEVVSNEWAALTLFGSFTLVLPSLISAAAIAGACHFISERSHAKSWWTYVFAGTLFGLFAAAIWCVALASMQNWRLSFGIIGDRAPGAPEPDPIQEAWRAAYFLGATGAVLGAWTSLIYWLNRRPDRDAANPPTSAP
jgi:hypothetical protein